MLEKIGNVAKERKIYRVCIVQNQRGHKYAVTMQYAINANNPYSRML